MTCSIVSSNGAVRASPLRNSQKKEPVGLRYGDHMPFGRGKVNKIYAVYCSATQSAIEMRGDEDLFERLAKDFFKNITSPNSRHLRTS